MTDTPAFTAKVATYLPDGPVGRAFLYSCQQSGKLTIAGAMGPEGCAKTTTALAKIVLEATNAAPNRFVRDRSDPSKGIHWTDWKHLTVRGTYRQLEKNVIPSWFRVVPKVVGHWKAEPPQTHTVTLRGRYGHVNLIMEFVALQDDNVEDVLKGWEGTSALLNEGDLLSPDVLEFLQGRVGRYPSALEGGPPKKRFILIDFNAPDVDNYLYDKLVENPVNTNQIATEFYRYPSGFSPHAENLKNLVPGYYQARSAGLPTWKVRRLVKNEFGYSRDGVPVHHDDYNEERHVASEPILLAPGVPLIVGIDAGLTPAASFRQLMPSGQQRTIDELVSPPDSGIGPTGFGQMLRAKMNNDFPNVPTSLVRFFADPASFDGGSKDGKDPAWVVTCSKALRSPIGRPSKNNQLTPRLEAVRVPMRATIDGQPGWLLSPKCKTIRKGYNSHYRYKLVQVAAGESVINKAEPEKNHWSHVANADEYAAQGCTRFSAQQDADNKRQAATTSRAPAAQNYSPLSRRVA